MRKVPKWFMIVAVLALLWNLLGCVAFVHDVMLSADDIAKMGATEQALYAARPTWALVATGVAVGLGALGCLGLILRRTWALPLLVLSLLGVIVQDIALFGMTRGIAVDPAIYAMQGIVLLVAIGLVWLARVAKRRHWFYARA
jgi:hypothetical protein